jgi:catechol 2,3-dioxygenase-like lactoylglutathione lyase family enzyme
LLTGLNHVTLAVSDLDRSLDFYLNLLGFKGHVRWDRGAYLSLGSLWLCLSLGRPCPKTDYTHLALDIGRGGFDDFVRRLRASGVVEWQRNSSEGPSIYFLDPDGHRLEIHAGGLQDRLASLKDAPFSGLEWL